MFFYCLCGSIIPPIIKNIKEKKQQRIKDEADRKEQERHESMGKFTIFTRKLFQIHRR